MVQKDKVVFLHTPKTGGGAVQWFLYEQFRQIQRNFFLSFSGVDDSRFIHDERSSPGEAGNRCVIERIFSDPSLVEWFRNSPHFQQARVLFGHTTFALGALFPEYNFRYLTVLREPIERTLSNIVQFSVVLGDTVKFGAYTTPSKKLSGEYWDFIYDILVREYPVAGLMIHENLYLRNCMTHVLQGSTYLDVHAEANLYLALVNAMRMEVSFFHEFNRGIERSFESLGITVDLSTNFRAQHGRPDDSAYTQQHGRYYDAPRKVVDLVVEQNAVDIRLYDILKSRSLIAASR